MLNEVMWAKMRMFVLAAGALLLRCGEAGLTLAMVLVFAFFGMFVGTKGALASGMTSYVMGKSTGTTAAVLCSGQSTFYYIKLGTAAVDGYIKCFNTATAASAHLGVDELLIDEVVASTPAVSPVSNVQGAVDNKEGAIDAATGISCIKSGANDVWFVRMKCS